ncbi:hypothetical protein BHM03_00036725 [Ensete ventricosum]|nr:hypothetical protein BHM03_00036725 [Ensete ventricosum]
MMRREHVRHGMFWCGVATPNASDTTKWALRPMSKLNKCQQFVLVSCAGTVGEEKAFFQGDIANRQTRFFLIRVKVGIGTDERELIQLRNNKKTVSIADSESYSEGLRFGY